jgi:phage protein D
MSSNLQPHIPHFNLKVDGAQVPKEVIDQLLECSIENTLNLPDACTLRLHDAKFEFIDSHHFREGKKMEVFGAEGNAQLEPLFVGEVTGLELDLAAHGVPTLVVRCMSFAHRLHRGRERRTFVQMKDSDIVKKVGSDAGFEVDADATSQVHAWVMQNNQTNWEFLNQLAGRNGFRLFVMDERKLKFKKVEDKGKGTSKLEWGKNLRSFRPRIAASKQVNEVVVRGWDPEKKQAIVGTYKKPSGIPQIGENSNGGDVAKKAFGEAKMVVTDRPVHSQTEANDMAKSICDEIGGGFLEAEGLCYATPKLRPGMMAEIKNIGKRFSGEYLVTSATHTYTPAEGYATQFSVSGKQPTTLLSLLEGNGLAKKSQGGNTIAVGIVTNNNDPDNLGRVKLKYPALTEEHESHWARIAAPMAGNDRGFEYLPEVEDEVLVAFEHGDIHRPYVIGSLWNGKDSPPLSTSEAVMGGSVVRRLIKTRMGHKFLIEDTPDGGTITLITKKEHQIVISDKDNKITAKTFLGYKMTLDDIGQKATMEDPSGQNSLTIMGSGMININCLANLTINSKGMVNITGLAGVSISSPATVNMTGGAAVTVQGAIVKIN